MKFVSHQSLNDWNEMFAEIYDKTQNYSKSAYEIHCHLTEVTGGFGKYFIKKMDFQEAKSFLTSIFAWSLTLIRKVTDTQRGLVKVDNLIYKKFPGVCPYCLHAPCDCQPNKKNTENYKKLKDIIYPYIEKNEEARIKDIQKVIRKIYEETWNKYERDRKSSSIHLTNSKEIAFYNISYLYSRLVEELAEIAESIRFYHLYKTNFENEIADFFAWFFAIISIYDQLYDNPEENIINIEELLWETYPGFCIFCNMPRCVCKPGPVRELLSKPSTEEYEYYDEVTQTENEIKLKDHIEKLINMGTINKSIFPISTIKIVISNYSKVKNDKETFNRFLRDLSSVLRKKIRYDKDRFYKKSVDELLILCHDTMVEEVEGLRKRIEGLMLERQIKSNYATIKTTIELNTFDNPQDLTKILQ